MPKYTQYAQQTTVAVDRSRAEIENTLRRYGASRFAYGWAIDKAVIQFEMTGRRIKFILPMPSVGDDTIRLTPSGRKRHDNQLAATYHQAVRQRWRALLLSIKAKLESVEAGIECFDDAFLAQIVVGDNTTVGDMVRHEIEQFYQTGEMPTFPLLEGPKHE